jgi:hypothetical protein
LIRSIDGASERTNLTGGRQMDDIVIEGLDGIVKAARKAHHYFQPTFSFIFVEPHTGDWATRWNAAIAAVADVGWGFTGGVPTSVLGGGQVSELRFIRDAKSGRRPPRLSGGQAAESTEGDTDG